MGKAFLMVSPIMVERHIVVMDQDLLVFFDRCAFYALAPFVFAEEIKKFIMVPSHKYMRVLPVHTACSRVHMHGRGKQEHGVYTLPFFFGLLGELFGKGIDEAF